MPRTLRAGCSSAARSVALLALAALPPLVALSPLAAAQSPKVEDHHGPAVAPGKTGPARFASALYDAFDPGAAMRDIAVIDQGYRAPGDPSYDAALELIAERLRASGFGKDPRMRLRFIETVAPSPVWIPVSASLVLRGEGRPAQVLHAFSKPADRDRTMLPIHAPPADVEGRPVFGLGDIEAGTVLVTGARVSQSLLRRAEKRGAVAVLSSALFAFSVDPTGDERHLDSILFTKVPVGTKFPVAQISRRTHLRIEAAAASGDAWLALTVETEEGPPVVRTLIAELVGSQRPDEAVAISSHAQEPGAGDNASGIAGLTESITSYVAATANGTLPWPARTLACVWGDEMRQTEAYLASTKSRVIAGISADMLGQSREQTGAIMLLERSPDPGALVTLAPDEHTPWGAGEVLAEDLLPNGLAVIARLAFADVAAHVGGWTTSENPWEGGSDHDIFLDNGIPGVLLWHFTDFSYHTSTDRIEMLDPEELRRSCAAVMSTALAITNADAQDLPRYLETNAKELEMRLRAADQAGEDENSRQWEEWCVGVAAWLEQLCADG